MTAIAVGRGLRGWALVVAVSIAQLVSWGVLFYAFSVVLVPMREALEASTLELAGALSLGLTISALAALPVGRYLDHHPPRWLMVGGSLAAAALVVAWSRVESVAALYLVWGGLGLTMAIVLYQAAFTILSKWFGERRQQALTVLTLFGAAASLIFSPLTHALVEAEGWRTALVVLAGILAAVTVPLHLLLPAGGRPTAKEVQERSEGGVRQVLRSSGFWLFNGSFGLAALAMIGMIVLLIPLLIERGYSGAFAATAAGIVGISQLPGRLAFGVVARFVAPATLLCGIYSAAITAALLLLAADTAGLVLIAAVLLGAANGMATLAHATLLGDRWGTKRYGVLGAVSAIFVTLAMAAAPISAAALPVLLGAETLEATLLASVIFSGLAGVAAVASYRRASAPPKAQGSGALASEVI
jgi:MFS family permease